MPDAQGCCGHVEFLDAKRIGNGVDDGGGRGDGAGFAAAFDTQGIRRARRDGEPDLVARQIVGPRQRVYLDGSDSSDSDGQIVQYHWTQVAGKTVSKKSADSIVANFVTPRVKRGAAITLGFELEVTDDLGATAVDQVNINVMR